MAGTLEVFTLTLNATTGGYTFTFRISLIIRSRWPGRRRAGLEAGGTLQATDKDGDVVTTSGSFTINVEDDVPVGRH